MLGADALSRPSEGRPQVALKLLADALGDEAPAMETQPANNWPNSTFSPASATEDPDPLDSAGKTICGLINRAADVVQENSQHALDVARKLSLQLEADETRIKDLEADLKHYQDRAHRAEKWLYQILTLLEQRFEGGADGRRAQAPPPQAVPNTNRRNA